MNATLLRALRRRTLATVRHLSGSPPRSARSVLRVPRDRAGTFEPVTVPKHQRRLGCGVSGAVDRRDHPSRSATGRPLTGPSMLLSAWTRPANATWGACGSDPQAATVAKQWATMRTELRNRGLVDALIVCCDGVCGLPESIRATCPDATVDLRGAHGPQQAPPRLLSTTPYTFHPLYLRSGGARYRETGPVFRQNPTSKLRPQPNDVDPAPATGVQLGSIAGSTASGASDTWTHKTGPVRTACCRAPRRTSHLGPHRSPPATPKMHNRALGETVERPDVPIQSVWSIQGGSGLRASP